ncbi:MAG: succinic semialdehyde dehydrogenase [Anaerolineae bacterium]
MTTRVPNIISAERNDRSTPPEGIIVSTSPATGRKLGAVRVATPEQIRAAMQKARAAQKGWYEAGLPFRLEVLRAIRANFHKHLDRFVALNVAEQGRPPYEALLEFLDNIELLRFYERRAAAALAPKKHFVLLYPHFRHWTEYHPYGVALVIAPWNFPLFLAVPGIIAALITGNAVIFKPSEYANLVGEYIGKIILESGIPDGVFQVIQGYGDVGAALIREKPDKIFFTGSVPTGKKVAMAAAEMLIPTTLELGAKDAAIVLEDADLDRAAEAIVWGAMMNAGQACLSIERVYALRPIAEALMQKMKAAIEKYVYVGPGEHPETTMGALTTEAQVKIVEMQVDEAVAQGARLICGGKRLQKDNHRYYAPTILTDVTPQMRLMREETFGPVVAVIPVDSDEEAVRATNDSQYGLTASIWTSDQARGLRIAKQIDAGHVGLNDHLLSASIPHLPWGGVKHTGYGRSRGIDGLYDMTYPKNFSVERFSNATSQLGQLYRYPYTPQKFNLIRWFVKVWYAPNWRERFKALVGKD